MPMPIKCVTLLFVACLVLSAHYAHAQTKRTKVVVDRQIKDTFSFTSQWAYYWPVMKDDSTGTFTKWSNEPLTPKDTAHLFYTANCETNVQGGYTVRYCYAQKSNSNLKLIFADGSPNYGGEFFCFIKRDSFYFKPTISYPSFIPGEHISYQVTKQQLTVNKPNYAIGDTLIGYVNVEFIEIFSVIGHGTKKTKLYLRGYIKTPVTAVAPYLR